MTALSHLVGALGGFDDPAVDEFCAQFELLDDPVALDDVCRELARTWTGRWRPRPAEVLVAYQEHPAVREAREARSADVRLASIGSTPWCQGTGWIDGPEDRRGATLRPCPRCNPILAEIFRDSDKWDRYMSGTPSAHLYERPKDFVMPPNCKAETFHEPERLIGWEEGRAIMNDAYRAVTGRNIAETPRPDPVVAERAIRSVGVQDRQGRWIATFTDVLEAFRGDQARCRASLNAIGRRLTDTDTGRLVLEPAPEPPEGAAERLGGPSGTPTAPESPEGLVDATAMMVAALGETARRVVEEP